MVQQRHKPPTRAPIRHQAPPPGPVSPKNGGGALWIFGAIALVALVIASQHSSPTTGTADGNQTISADMGNAQQALVSAVAAQKPPTPAALSPTAVRRGAGRVSLAGREGPGGEMIYSQNCYDVVGRAFSWSKLDECGAFDAEAARSLADDASAMPTEVAWFDTETAAGRYLKAATAAGLEATSADERLSDLQRRIERRHPAVAPTASSTPTADTESATRPDPPLIRSPLLANES